jgi:hypothetical protein
MAQVHDEVVRRAGRAEGKEWHFLGPEHNEHKPSCRWNREKKVWYCDACACGGGYKELAELLNLVSRDSGLTVADPAAAKGLSAERLRGWGVREGVSGSDRTACVDIPYADETGETSAVRVVGRSARPRRSRSWGNRGRGDDCL